jgi:hypothetical protein
MQDDVIKHGKVHINGRGLLQICLHYVITKTVSKQAKSKIITTTGVSYGINEDSLQSLQSSSEAYSGEFCSVLSSLVTLYRISNLMPWI